MMSVPYRASGLPSSWLNAWLAALGVCVLMPEVRLSWTDEPVPSAIFHIPFPEASFPERLAALVPGLAAIERLAIAKKKSGLPDLERKVTLVSYKSRAELARANNDPSLAATLTDLAKDPSSEGLPHSPFDPAVPRGITLWERLVSCRKSIEKPGPDVEATLRGQGRRVPINGLGFDAQRLVAGVQLADKTVDPVIEVLAFCALELFPVRASHSGATTATVRGWDGRPGRAGSFQWYAWRQSLDRWGIDALLDVVPRAKAPDKRAAAALRRLGVVARYASVPYLPASTSDATRAYASERL